MRQIVNFAIGQRERLGPYPTLHVGTCPEMINPDESRISEK
jgi:hypothetical protein